MILLNYIISKQLVCVLLIIIIKVIYTNGHHLIMLQFPFILNIKIYFRLFCRLIPSLNWRQALSFQLIVLLIFQHCVLQLLPNLVG